MARRTSDFEDAFASEGKVVLKPGGEEIPFTGLGIVNG